MARQKSIGLGLVGAHSWAEEAHLPGYSADPRYRLAAICDTVPERARRLAEKFGIARVHADVDSLLADADVEVVDICTSTASHFELSLRALDAGKHVLCEKPIALATRDALQLARKAAETGLHNKVGFTYRNSPAIRQIKSWIDDGTLGEIFHVHGLMQNSQFLDPDVAMRQYGLEEQPEGLSPASVIGYGSHLVDTMRWCAGEFAAVSASMHNYIPERAIRGHAGRHPLAIEDGTVAAIEFASGAQGTLQTSYIAIGAYPGLELRVYGSKGAAVARLVKEGGIAETLHAASAGDIEFRPVTLDASHYPAGTSVRTLWSELYYRGLVSRFADEIVEGAAAEGDFGDGAMAQCIVDALILSHRERRWVAPADLLKS